MRSVRIAGSLAAAALLLSACTAEDHTPPYVKDGTADLDLSVTGQPFPKTLALVEKALVRIQRHDADGLAELSYDGEHAKETAGAWVAKWGAAARKPMVANFLVSPKKYVDVKIRFKGVKGTLSLTLQEDTDDWTYGIVTREGFYDD
ncbi:hypothetical protein [Streptomyces sp. MNP-20]|uniref:hypothetical protein n=1 Tax=Streptomyces sp. MNP-20 TaxID=2721165 RepID=UPI001551762B|nr:hypothetical protein [Streptomyces sp. MNP-20]